DALAARGGDGLQGRLRLGCGHADLLLALGRAPRRPEQQDEDQHEEERDGEHAGAREDECQDDEDDRDDAADELARHRSYSAGPEKPSRRMRQKWTAMKRLAISGMKMQWRM